jgi:hypothetical protein
MVAVVIMVAVVNLVAEVDVVVVVDVVEVDKFEDMCLFLMETSLCT